jgi:formylmethanofuran dehydrogenase subunit C
MSKLYVTFAYTIKGSTFEIVDTNMKAGIITLIDAYLREATGAGADDSEAVERDVYEITLAVDLTEDTITVKSNCGNLGLVAGILMDILRELTNED